MAGPRLIRLIAIVLAILTVTAAFISVEVEDGPRTATPRLGRLVQGLVSEQSPDGVFDPYPAEAELPQVLRTLPHALTTAALARAWRMGAEAYVPDLRARLDLALDRLVDRQQPGGSFGGMPPGRPGSDRWPSVEATAAGTLALALAARPQDAGALTASMLALERTLGLGLRDGWTRALVALSLDAAAARGGNALVGRDLRAGLTVGEPGVRPDARDPSLAEAVVRRILATPGTWTQDVAAFLAEKPLAYEGERSNLQTWWLGAWLVVRTEGDGAYLASLGPALDAALEAPPTGRIGESWYADHLTEGAAGLLALAEVLDPLGSPPFPGLDPHPANLASE